MNGKLYPRKDTIRAFFPKIMVLVFSFQKRPGEAYPLLPLIPLICVFLFFDFLFDLFLLTSSLLFQGVFSIVIKYRSRLSVIFFVSDERNSLKWARGWKSQTTNHNLLSLWSGICVSIHYFYIISVFWKDIPSNFLFWVF